MLKSLLCALVIFEASFCYADVEAIPCAGDEGCMCVSTYLRLNGYSGTYDFPESSGYEEAVGIDNKRVATLPAIVLSPARENDVSLAILATTHCNLTMSVLSGGHSAAGYCLSSGGVTLNMRESFSNSRLLPDNEIGGTIYVEAGSLWKGVYETTQNTKYLPIGGGCTTVGGGFLLGGGWSFLSRSYGLGSDNVISFQMALANGTIAEASAQANTDLYWAVLGSGGGNFGVVLSFILQLHEPRSQRFLAGELCWEPFDPVIGDVWSWWLDAWETMPSWMLFEPAWLLLSSDEKSDPRMFCLTVICNGDPASECSPLVDPVVERFSPVVNDVVAQPFTTWQMANANVTDAQEGYLYLTSGILPPGALTTELIAQLMAAMENAPSNKNIVLFHTGGGEIANVGAEETAFVHRNVEVVIQIKSIWDAESDAELNINWVKSTRMIVEPYLTGSYVNYIDPYLADWKEAYYGANYARLLDIKNLVDPLNFFHFNQSIY